MPKKSIEKGNGKRMLLPAIKVVLLLANAHSVSSFAPSASFASLARGEKISSTAAYAESVASPTAEEKTVDDDNDGKHDVLPLQDGLGVYKIRSEAQYKAFLEANIDKLVVLKSFAPWCKACKRLEPRFNGLVRNKKYEDIPITFADISVSENKRFIQSLGVVALPTLQFHANGEIVETFPAGPRAFPVLGKKMDTFISRYTNDDMTIKPADAVVVEAEEKEEAPPDEAITAAQKLLPIIRGIPYFENTDEAAFEKALSRAKFMTFEEGSVILKEGTYGIKFYVIVEGEVEVCRRLSVDQASNASPSYLGNVVSHLKAGDYFGERSLITKEPCAASIRATSTTRVFAFSAFFGSSPMLAGKSDLEDVAAEKVRMDKKYGLSMAEEPASATSTPTLEVDQDSIIPLLVRFKLIRSVTRCFDYIVSNRVDFGEESSRQRRTKYVQMLGPSTFAGFNDAFNLIDKNGDGDICLAEMRRVMDSIGKKKTDEELLKVIETSSEGVDGEKSISLEDFMGLMAESEIYNLLTGTFRALDENNAGYVSAEDLDNVLSGVRGLISEDRKNVLTLDDKDILIDYEQFSKMLLGNT